MRYYQAVLEAVAVSPAQYPDPSIPEVAFVGRSNVGKSSLINKLLNRHKLARVSVRPGKTQTINFYKVDNSYYYTDLPGYGFAAVSKETKKKWGKIIEDYLKKRKNLKGVVLLVDVRHSPTEDDITMYNWLKYYKIPVVIAATKLDKITRSKWKQHFTMVRQGLKMEDGCPLLGVSSESGQGVEELRTCLFSMMGVGKVDETGERPDKS